MSPNPSRVVVRRASPLGARGVDALRRYRRCAVLWSGPYVADQLRTPAVLARVSSGFEAAELVAVAPLSRLVADRLLYSEGIRESQGRGPFIEESE